MSLDVLLVEDSRSDARLMQEAFGNVNGAVSEGVQFWPL